MQIYVHKNNQQIGPFTEAEIRAQLAAGTISLQDHVWWQGQATWMPLGQTSLIIAGSAPAPEIPAPVPGIPSVTAPLPHREHTSGLAIGALASNLACCIGSPVAIILGHLALSAIKRNPALKGHGLAMAGLIIGYVITGLGLAYLVMVFVVFASMGDQVKEIFKTINSQLAAAAATPSGSTTDDSTTNSDSSTNSSDSTTPTNSADQSTNSATATPATNDSSTNTPTATPVNQ